MKIGYHKSISNGLIQTVKEIKEEGMTSVQIFAGSPRNYFPSTKHTFDDFLAMSNLNIPKFVHINYFVNLCGDKEVIQDSIAKNMIFCDEINADGLVIHMGSHKDVEQGMSKTFENILFARKKYNELTGETPRVKLLIETTSEGGNRLKWNSIIALLKLEPSLGMVYDTAHMYAAGYDVIRQIEEYHNIIDLVHLNNPSSNVEFGKHKDQHDISLFSEEGKFSLDEINEIIKVCDKYKLPMILETGDMYNDFIKIKNRKSK